MKTNLILLEGLPGTGKSTWLEQLNDYLTTMSLSVKTFSEDASDHPVDFDGKACFTQPEFDRIQQHYKPYALTQYTENFDDKLFFDYKTARQDLGNGFPGAFLKRCITQDVYELPFDQYENILLKRWQRFVESHQKSKHILIFECTFLQNPITKMLIQSNMTEHQIENHITKIESILSAITPMILYLENTPIDENFKKIYRERPESWQKMFIDYYTQHDYGLAHGLNGLNGAIKILEHRAAIENKLLEKSILPIQVFNTKQISEQDIPSLLRKRLPAEAFNTRC